MRRKKFKVLSLCMAAILAMSGLTGCTNKNETGISSAASTEETVTTEDAVIANQFAYTDGTEEELKSTTIQGTVAEVDENSITLSIGGGMGQAPSGEAPSGEAPSGEAPSGEAPSEMPESKEGILTINDTSVLVSKAQGENLESSSQATLEDIEEGMMVSITFDENGNISEIAISEGGMPNGMVGEQSSGFDSYTAVNEYTKDTTISE